MVKFRKTVRPWLLPPSQKSRVRRYVVAPILWLGVMGLCVGLVLFGYFHVKALTFSYQKLKEVPERTLVFDRKGEPIGHVSGHGENRVVVSIDEVSPQFVAALLAREDSRFYAHGGVDLRGVARAAVRNLRSGDFDQGASTITMQLARNTWGLRQMTLSRKLQEVAMAQQMELRLSKDEILEMYVNRIYFGSGLYGIERAAQGYFMKPAEELTLGEGAILAGLIRGPSVLNPFRNLESAKAVRDEVLARMVVTEVITEAEAEAARQEMVTLRPPGERLATGSYVLQTIHDFLGDLLTLEDINAGGLRVTTTIDAAMQEAAEQGLDGHLAAIENRPGFPHPPRSQREVGDRSITEYVQGAVVSLDNRTGAILAMVGGRDFSESSFNRALEAKRQCGSTFKPFVYAVAFDRGGLMPGTWISDDAVRYSWGAGQVWSPSNSDGQFLGNQPAAVGLIRSRNTMSVRVGEIAGLENVRGLARALKMGNIPESPVSYLGAFETTPMTLTSAYSTLAGGGANRAPFLIQRVENGEGEVLFEAVVRAAPVLRESVCWLTSDIMGRVMDGGTGSSARSLGYKVPCYGKTGTTNDYRDAWFVGYTDKVTTGVWVGMDRPATIMNRGYGSTLALPVWVDVMKAAEGAGFPAEAMRVPDNQQGISLCRACGGRAQRRSLEPYSMGLPRDLWPEYECGGHGGLFDMFTSRDDVGGQGRYRSRDRREPGGEGGIGGAIRGIGRFIFGSSR
ncbi:MAG: PBP1A family penicillin-binding protein [Verrucomicrobiota bacterium]